MAYKRAQWPCDWLHLGQFIKAMKGCFGPDESRTSEVMISLERLKVCPMPLPFCLLDLFGSLLYRLDDCFLSELSAGTSAFWNIPDFTGRECMENNGNSDSWDEKNESGCG